MNKTKQNKYTVMFYFIVAVKRTCCISRILGASVKYVIRLIK